MIASSQLSIANFIMNFFIKGYGCLRAAISFFILLILALSISTTSPLAADSSYLDALLKAADDKQLYRDRSWEVLLHYKKNLTGVKSLIDDPDFFLSPDGGKNPKSELEATLKGFLHDGNLGDSHPRCRFVARYEWLRAELNIDESQLPVVSCKEFDEAYSRISPKSAVLVFPAAYINGPASTFGHTLIRIDGDYQSKLLTYAATYAAHANDTNGILYAFKGIFGYYNGYFTILPYYEKIKEYSDLEQRDIWEYRLNLTEEEVSKMLLHLWELKEISSDYYFFDENCSYNLLFLLEAARPSLRLTDEFGSWVIPLDTLRAIMNEGLVEAVEYRPSKGTRIRHIASLLDQYALNSTAMVVANKLEPEDIKESRPGDLIKILDLASELLQYRYNKRELTKEEYQGEFLDVLLARSRLGNSEKGDYTIPVPKRPEEGHGSSRLSLGVGLNAGDSFQEVRYRAAQHELSDPSDGYIEGSEIVFFSLTARSSPAYGGVRMEALDIIDIVSISPWDQFFKPTSWKVSTGFLQKTMSDGDDELVFRLNTGGGLAFKNDLVGLYSLMLEPDLSVGGSYKDGYALGIGPSVAIIRDIADFWKMNLFANAVYYEIGDRHKAYRVTAQQVLGLSRNNSLNLDLTWMRDFDIEQNELKLNWNLYL